jgi:hypothetical protein
VPNQRPSKGKRRARRLDLSPPEIQPLISVLRQLVASGPEGFEGLARDLLAAVTGMRYRLMKSGPQAGADALSDPLAPGLRVAMEGKRYEHGTTLPLDELKAKLHDAIDQQDDLDIWVLAATREISAGDAMALGEAGARRGVSVEILDVPGSPGGVPELALLCAILPEVTLVHFRNAPGVAASLQWAKSLPDFAARSSSLVERLTRPELGYSNARTTVDAWLQNAMSNVATARARLGGYVDVLVPGSQRITRTGLDQQLDRWWATDRGRLLALLGDEGVGKTWEALSWWLARRGAQGGAMPLTLFVPAAQVSTSDPGLLIAETLHRHTGLRDVAYWQRRVNTWMSNASHEPRILLLIDGLNQHPFFKEWGELFQRLCAPPFANGVAVAITDRPDDWKNRLRSLADLSPPPCSVDVTGFTDTELDKLLAENSLARGDFQPAVVELLKVPRLCQLAMRLRLELQNSGDITRERLVLEEWKDRLKRRAQGIRMDDAEFRAWLTTVGQRIRDDLRTGADSTITRRDLIVQLGRESGASDLDLYAAVSEIVDGRWLEPAGSHRFRIRTDLSPLALGLALVEHLRESPEVLPATVIAEFVDPLRGQDIAVSILRAAVTFAFVDASTSTDLRRALLTAWLSAPNFEPNDFEALWRLTPLAADVVCDVADQFWSTANGGHFRDEVLTKALSNACKWPAVESTLQERVATWLGRYKSDPRATAAASGTPPKGGEERRQRTSERRASWDSAAVVPKDAATIECTDDVETGWLSHRAIALLSHLPRRPFVRALRAWAVSRAIIGSPEEFEEVAWLLRLNQHDPSEAEAALLDESETLLRTGSPIATAAAGLLLRALASRRAMETAAAHHLLEESPFAGRRSERIPVTNGTIDWPGGDGTVDSAIAPPLRQLRELAHFAQDPSVDLPPGAGPTLHQCADATDVSTLWRSIGVTDSDHALDLAAPVLARWAPDALANLLRRAYSEGRQRSGDAVAGLAFALRRSLLVLQPEQVNALADVILLQGIQPAARDTLAIALLRDRPASHQAELLLESGRGIDIWDARRLFAAVADSDLPFFTTLLESGRAAEDLVRVLEFLVAGEAQFPRGYAPLLPLIEHSDPRVRGYALMWIWQLNDAALDGFVRDKWSFQTGMPVPERKYGSLILCRNVSDADVQKVIQRIDPQALGYLATHTGSDEARRAFTDYVREQVGLLVRGEGPSSWPAFWADDVDATSTAIGKLVLDSPDEVFGWFAPLLSNGAHFQAHEEFPFVLICRQLLTHAPGKGAILWTKLHDLSHESSMRFQIEGFETMAFAVPDSPAVSELRMRSLRAAKTDRELAAIAAAACGNQAEGWLISYIEDAVRKEDVGEIARGITVAGLLDKTPEADRLWAGTLSTSPAAGWLADVHSHAYADYQENARARHWFELFLGEADHDGAHGAYLLFLTCVDARGVEWAPRVIGDRWNQTPRAHRAHHALCWREARKRADTRDRERERTLFHTNIPSRLQAPWVS